MISTAGGVVWHLPASDGSASRHASRHARKRPGSHARGSRPWSAPCLPGRRLPSSSPAAPPHLHAVPAACMRHDATHAPWRKAVHRVTSPTTAARRVGSGRGSRTAAHLSLPALRAAWATAAGAACGPLAGLLRHQPRRRPPNSASSWPCRANLQEARYTAARPGGAHTAAAESRRVGGGRRVGAGRRAAGVRARGHSGGCRWAQRGGGLALGVGHLPYFLPLPLPPFSASTR